MSAQPGVAAGSHTWKLRFAVDGSATFPPKREEDHEPQRRQRRHGRPLAAAVCGAYARCDRSFLVRTVMACSADSRSSWPLLDGRKLSTPPELPDHRSLFRALEPHDVEEMIRIRRYGRSRRRRTHRCRGHQYVEGGSSRLWM